MKYDVENCALVSLHGVNDVILPLFRMNFLARALCLGLYIIAIWSGFMFGSSRAGSCLIANV